MSATLLMLGLVGAAIGAVVLEALHATPPPRARNLRPNRLAAAERATQHPTGAVGPETAPVGYQQERR